jgi:hypothetical protein
MISMRQIPAMVLGMVLMTNTAFSADSVTDQVTSVNKRISENIKSQNWDALDKNYQELYSLFSQNYEPDNSMVASITKVLGRWKIQAYRSKLLSENRSKTINDALNFYTSVTRDTEDSLGENSPVLIEPLYGLTMVNYILFEEVAKKAVNKFAGKGSETVEEFQCVSASPGPGGSDEDACDYIEVPDQDYLRSQQQEKARQVVEHLDKIDASLGRIAKIIESNPSLPVTDHAEVLVHLGDYNFVRKNTETAIEFYQRAYLLLSDGTAGSKSLERLFEKPVMIPALSLSFPGASNDTGVNNKITLAFDITANGKTKNIEVVSERDPGNKTARNGVTNVVTRSTFRPRFVDGKLVDSQRVEMSFQ